MKTKTKADVFDEAIGARLKFFRLLKGYSQEELAEVLDISFQQVQKYEKGVNRIAASRLYKMSQILDIKLVDFFENAHIENASQKIELNLLEDTDFLFFLKNWHYIKNEEFKSSLKKIIESYAQSNF
jgi:transcriptional regulator with XRE-family HTH domain